MLLLLKILLGLVTLVLIFLWGQWTFTTEKIATEHGISSTNNTGSNYLKGDIGGVLLGAAIIIGLFLYQGDMWLYPTVILMSCVILGRLISLFMDGKSKMGIQAIIVEFLIIALMFGISSFS